MKSSLAILLPILLLLNACVTQNANLQDLSTNVAVTQEKNGAVTTNTTTRTITTRLKGVAWFSSKQSLEKFKALQTDKTQSVGASSITQQGATNTAGVLSATTKLLEEINKLKNPIPE